MWLEVGWVFVIVGKIRESQVSQITCARHDMGLLALVGASDSIPDCPLMVSSRISEMLTMKKLATLLWSCRQQAGDVSSGEAQHPSHGANPNDEATPTYRTCLM